MLNSKRALLRARPLAWEDQNPAAFVPDSACQDAVEALIGSHAEVMSSLIFGADGALLAQAPPARRHDRRLSATFPSLHALAGLASLHAQLGACEELTLVTPSGRLLLADIEVHGDKHLLAVMTTAQARHREVMRSVRQTAARLSLSHAPR
jgi:predicted regulator of Ras-like GTPase activity (Roadblock/LC7/MglB family)